MSLQYDHFKGLSTSEAVRRQKNGGNVLFKKKKKGFFDYVMQIFNEPMLLLLLATALIYFLVGEAWDGFLMLIGVLLMIGIDLYQEAKTDKALDALKELSTPKISVIRDEKLISINNDELVVGDALVVREGERIAGDGMILDSSNFSVDESMLTGESGSIHKANFETRNSKLDLESTKSDIRYSAKRIFSEADIRDSNSVFAGTLCLTGQAVIKVTAVGTKTQYGRIGESLAEINESPTPLQKKTRRLVQIFGIIGLFSCISLFFINFANTKNLIDSLLKGLTLAISVIPEELPVVLAVFAALGAYRLTKKNALIKKINAIETLGSITTLCTDKTGTLTVNRMELQDMIGSEGRNMKSEEFLKDAMLACPSEPFDPADLSIFETAKQSGVDIDSLQSKNALTREYGFDNKLKFIGYAWKNAGKTTLYAKGGAEQIIERSKLTAEEKKLLLKNVDKLSARGMRVLALAKKNVRGALPVTLSKADNFEFISLLAFRDPPKTEAKQAVLACERAGIAVRMITGDHPKTALHIATAVGINHKNKIMTGLEIDAMTDEELTSRIHGIKIFARVQPEQKLKIVRALQAAGEIVAMIGDGVNDAPSLKEADVGIAMGLGGTNVAREAADMILMDDQLNTVVSTIHDGRRIYDNIQKGISYIFGIHIYVILIALVVPLMGMPSLLLPIHIVLIELIIDPTCSLVFEAMPAEADIAKRKPLDPKRPIISIKRFLRILVQGISIFALTFATYYLALKYGASVETARTLGFSVILWSNLFNVITAASYRKPELLTGDILKNKTFLVVYTVMLVAFVGMIYLPHINFKLSLTSIPVSLFLMTVALGLIPAIGSDIYKKMRA
ncbi:MAG: cation-translocating P-type ATPase [Patescibacteria group bacterium]|nr:cation-translocating P-type ATPase [Patescibacteria group bacterium]